MSVSTSTTRPRWGGTEGNEVLTIGAAVVLTVQLVVEGITIIWMGALVTVHPSVGMVLIPPVALKLGSTGYRFARHLLLRVRGGAISICAGLDPVPAVCEWRCAWTPNRLPACASNRARSCLNTRQCMRRKEVVTCSGLRLSAWSWAL